MNERDVIRAWNVISGLTIDRTNPRIAAAVNRLVTEMTEFVNIVENERKWENERSARQADG